MVSKLIQYGIPRQLEDIKCIVIHNTSNYDMSARQLYDYLENECSSSQGTHFLVDSEEVIEVMPLDYAVWHTGVAYDYGNMHGIAIEICSNRDTDTYLKGQDRAINLIKELMERYDLTKDDIYFHNDFCDTNCPANIIQLYGTKKEFINRFLEGE